MTARDGRGGPRVPDGIPRPAALPFSRGPNRSDLSELPGTPGTPLPPSPAEPQVHHGQAGRLRSMMQGLPMDSVVPTGKFTGPSQRPGEPMTSGIDMGMGPDSSSLLPSPNQLTDKMTSAELQGMYPLLMRLATLPNATTETKILAQRIRANLPLSPEQMPDLSRFEDGLPGST